MMRKGKVGTPPAKRRRRVNVDVIEKCDTVGIVCGAGSWWNEGRDTKKEDAERSDE